MAVTPFQRRVRVLFGSGLATDAISRYLTKELKREVTEAEVANNLSRALDAAYNGELVWPYATKRRRQQHESLAIKADTTDPVITYSWLDYP